MLRPINNTKMLIINALTYLKRLKFFLCDLIPAFVGSNHHLKRPRLLGKPSLWKQIT